MKPNDIVVFTLARELPPGLAHMVLSLEMPCTQRRVTMKPKKDLMPEYLEAFEPEYTGRPLVFLKDKDGNGWLCDKEVDPNANLRDQGCWRCDEMSFPLGGR